MIEVAAIDFYVNDKGYKSLLYSKETFLELLRSFVKHGWVEKIHEKSIVRAD